LFIKLWNFLWGYVKIEISGFSVERFINRAAALGLVFWDLQRLRGGKFAARLSRADFKRITVLSEKTGSIINVLSFHGLPYLLLRLRKRLFLVVGALVFIAGLITLTSFIWRIDIEGTDRIDPAEILSFLEQNDFAAGRFRHGLAYRDIENLLYLEFNDIAWVSFSVVGTRAVIRIIETIEGDFAQDNGEIADIVAAKDGIIVYMATSAGKPLFRPGDVVAAGEVIVAGRLDVGTAEEGNLSHKYVRAEAAVWARVYYRMDFEIPLTYYERTFTGQSSWVYSIIIGSREMSLPLNFGAGRFNTGHDFRYYETVEIRRQASLGADYPLPLVHIRQTTYELTRHLRSRSIEQAEHLAIEFATRRINEEIGPDVDILTKEITFTEGERSLLAEVFLITIERIDKVQEIQAQEIQEIQEIRGEENVDS
jgi:similar to stage IV sporulation protein